MDKELNSNVLGSIFGTKMIDAVSFEIERSLKESLVYLTVKKIIINQLFSDKPSDLYSLIGNGGSKQSDGMTRCRIIELNSDDKK